MSMMYLDGGQHRPDLARALRVWAAAQPFWLRRTDVTNDMEWLPGYSWGPDIVRPATVEEIAANLVNDPHVREALTALDSPVGQYAEQLVAEMFLPQWQAKLLVDGLSVAEKIILDESRPIWLRADVLTGVGIAFGVMFLIGLCVWAGRKPGPPS